MSMNFVTLTLSAMLFVSPNAAISGMTKGDRVQAMQFIDVTSVSIEVLVGCVHFERLSAEIAPQASQTLDLLVQYMREFDPYTGYIHGYADELEMPDRTRRADLAEARARALRDALIDMGVENDRFVVYAPVESTIEPDDGMGERIRRNAAACLFTAVLHN